MSERQTSGEFKNYIIGRRSGKTYNKIQEMAKEIDKLQKELEQEKEKNNRQLEIDTAEEVLKWKGKYHLLSRKINGVLEDKIKDKIKEYQNKLCTDIEEEKVAEYENIIEVLEELLEE